MLSENTSAHILSNVHPRWVFSGHDHEGCQITYIEADENTNDRLYAEIPRIASRSDSKVDSKMLGREITVRSAMAEFGGTLGLFSFKALSDAAVSGSANRSSGCISFEDYEYCYSQCQLISHNPIWATLITDLLVLSLLLLRSMYQWRRRKLKTT
jgi:hypothetical protein